MRPNSQFCKSVRFIWEITELSSAFEENGIIFYVNSTGDLYSYDIDRERSSYIRNISGLIKKYGLISSIISYHDDLVISFKSNGVLKLVSSLKYSEEFLDMNSGVFLPEKRTGNRTSFGSGSTGRDLGPTTIKPLFLILFLRPHYPFPLISRYVVFLQIRNNTLWVGTKGDGLLLISDYDRASVENIPASNVKYYTTRDGLSNNQVFAIAGSNYYPVVWLGTEGPGLSYFSLKDKRIFTLPNSTTTPIRRVHSIAEQNDSTVWMATSGYGLLKVAIRKEKEQIKIKAIKTFFFKA